MYEDIVRDFSAVVAGRGYAGQVSELMLPKCTIITEDLRAGGMDGTDDVDMGQEKMVASITTHGFHSDLLDFWGIWSEEATTMIFRGALQSRDGTIRSAVATMRGAFREDDPGTWKKGSLAPLKATMTCRYYKLEVDGAVKREIDVYKFIRIIDGVDQLERYRAALGI